MDKKINEITLKLIFDLLSESENDVVYEYRSVYLYFKKKKKVLSYFRRELDFFEYNNTRRWHINQN